ncbi:sushi, von Willebrand factor type A, EGF and pentraxin domain-containing protein 1 isoform X5 [Esox lucius]|uniref:sushi, von Willebrand factor type A, EGF and pentraxin domain-containing protein 1 isoform X5 n=1 Tax=Esox lucius TaxID=8010 RepID=UPI001476A79D|nr:sushi, von Willebrand factor type A, EGF and pentraxin domain-containing protein 1 isoform X5 [Esox lucius]
MVGRVAEVNQASPAGRGCEVGFHRGLIEGDPLSHSGRGDSSVVDLSLPSTPHQAKFIPKDQLETQQWMAILRLTPFNNLSPLVCDAGHQVKIAIVMVSETHWIFLQETLHRVCRTETTLIGQTLDVCATCHPNATCEEKVDGTGKVCNCMYGFLGNGRTYCQDKDECQMGTSKICGKNTACHNTYGSYYCTCLTGYSPSNSMAIFIPNDGTHCQDIDECRIQGICGEGGQCTNIPGNFHCHCQVGYRVQNGAEPFHPHQDQAVCKAIDCGQPPLAENAVRLSATGTRYGSIAKFACAEGFLRNSGDNFAICGTEGVWKGPSLLCEEVDCGSPPALPHSVMFWDQRTNMGSEVFYQCNFGYKNVGEGNVSHCNADGQWDKSALLCEAILCGDPPILPHTGQVWNGSTNPGSTVLYYCKEGFYRAGGGNISYCTEYGYWTNVTLSCKEITCGDPSILPHTGQVWNGSTNPGSTVLYYCEKGFYRAGGGNNSYCTEYGYWTNATLSCKEITCGDPSILPHTGQVWNGSTNPGSTVLYYCEKGFYRAGGGNNSYCTEYGYWTNATLSCKEITCGDPSILPHTGQVWNGSTNPGSTVLYYCKEGFYRAGGGNISYCTEYGYWTNATLSCKEITCGNPPILPHTGQVWNGSTNPGSTVLYYCKEGFYRAGGGNNSYCTEYGYWTNATLSCKEVDCGSPPALPHSVMFWDQRTNMGSEVFYQCNFGYKNVGEGNVSHCMADGAWDQITFLCEEIDCGEPLFIPNTKMIWNRTSLIGSVVYYQCVEGYYNTSGINYTECGENGLWTDIKLQCEEVNCGPPLTLPHANMQWTNRTGLGSVIEYICKQGFYQAGGNSLSTCTPSGQWGIVSIICKAKCGPVPALANSEVVWQNVSAVMHRCVEGFHSWRGRNTSLCDIHGKWQSATIRCREIKPPISDLVFLNEKCLRWKADKYEADAENYQVEIVGFRAYQRSFHDKRKKLLRSISDHPEICLNLLPVTNYTFSITALSARFTSTLTAKTSLREPQAPEIVYSEVEAPLPTLWLRRFPNTLDPISFYQVFVCPLDGFLLFDCSSTRNPDFSIQRKSHGLYITAQVHLIDVWKKMNLTVGDGRYYGGFYNAPLQNGRDYYIILRAVSHWGGASKHCCFIWAKVSGTSYLMKVSSLYAAGSIGVVALAMCLGYCYTWFFKKT